MWLVNDSFFYVTAYGSKSIYSFSATHIYTQWNETFVSTAFNGIAAGGADHVKIDGSGRFWVPFETDTIFIYDQQGTTLGNLTIPNSAILDIKIMNNYLIYFTATNTNGTIRLDPNIHC
jgi:sugar lactone lactonase YvrE